MATKRRHKALRIGNRFKTVVDCPRYGKQLIVTNCASCRYYNCGGKDFTSCLFQLNLYQRLFGGENDFRRMTAKEEQERREREVIKPAQAICDIINDAFSVMPHGFVRAPPGISKDSKPTISLRIGTRDVRFTLDGDEIGRGMNLASEWFERISNILKQWKTHGKKYANI